MFVEIMVAAERFFFLAQWYEKMTEKKLMNILCPLNIVMFCLFKTI